MRGISRNRLVIPPHSDFCAAFFGTMGFDTGKSNAGTSLQITHPLFITWSTEALALCSPRSGPQYVTFYILCQREEAPRRWPDELLCRKCAFLRWGQSPQAGEGCTLPLGSICVTQATEEKKKYLMINISAKCNFVFFTRILTPVVEEHECTSLTLCPQIQPSTPR